MSQHLDVTLKSLFLRSTGIFTRQLFGEIVAWQNVEQPTVSNRRADLLARCADGTLRHIEIQLKNDLAIPFRMAEYYLGFHRILNEHVIQILLYVGREPLRMPAEFVTPAMRHEYILLNLRDMDGEALLASDDWADNEWALLTKTDPERVIRVVLEKLRRLNGEERKDAAATFLLLGGILGIEEDLRKRIENPMIDILQNKVLGPLVLEQIEIGVRAGREEIREEAWQEGRQEGRQEGHQEGRQEGRQEASRALSRRLIEKRFGPLPVWAQARLAEASSETLTDWILALDEAGSLEAVFRT